MITVAAPDRAYQSIGKARVAAPADRARLAFRAPRLGAHALASLGQRLKKLDGSIKSAARAATDRGLELTVLTDRATRESLQRIVATVRAAAPGTVFESVAFEIDDCGPLEFRAFASAVAHARAQAARSPIRKLLLAQADPPVVAGTCDDPSFVNAAAGRVATGDIALPEVAMDQQVRLTYRLR